MHEVIMPKLGLTMESGKIEKWHKKEGDKVGEGDVLFEVMTDKVSLEVESYNSGILRKILKDEGEEVPVTEVIAYIGEKDEKIPDAPSQSPAGETGADAAVASVVEKSTIIAEPSVDSIAATSPVKQPEPADGRIKISPLARKIAGEKNIDISTVKGSGPRGRIVKEDIEKIITDVEKAGTSRERIKISPLARKTARPERLPRK